MECPHFIICGSISVLCGVNQYIRFNVELHGLQKITAKLTLALEPRLLNPLSNEIVLYISFRTCTDFLFKKKKTPHLFFSNNKKKKLIKNDNFCNKIRDTIKILNIFKSTHHFTHEPYHSLQLIFLIVHMLVDYFKNFMKLL